MVCGGIPPWFWVNPLLVSTCSNNCIRGQCAGGHGLRGSALPNKPFSQNTEHSTLPSRGQPATASPTKQQTFPNQFPCSALVPSAGAGRGGEAWLHRGPARRRHLRRGRPSAARPRVRISSQASSSRIVNSHMINLSA